MNTINNSNTVHFCKDCESCSKSSCKNGYGENTLPCHILRKLAKMCTSIYKLCYKNEANLIPDFYDKVRIWSEYEIRYLDNLTIEKRLIQLSMSCVVNGHTDNYLDIVNEFSDDIELTINDRHIIEKLISQIKKFQYKINKVSEVKK